MRSIIAALRSLVLPAGTTTGRRIVLDGVKGVIQVFRSDGTLGAQMGNDTIPNFEDAFQSYSADPSEEFPGSVSAGIIGAGGARNLIMEMTAPTFVGATASPVFRIESESEDNTEPPVFFFNHGGGAHGKFRIPAAIGSATLVAGTVTVNRPVMVGANFSRVFLSRRTVGGAPGFLSYTQIAGTSFTINSTSATDTSVVEWAVFDE